MPKISQVIVIGVLVLVAGAFSLWQWYEYQADVAAAKEVLHSHAEGLFRAVVGAIRSHRRLGAFFDQQIQVILDEIVSSPDVLVVQIASEEKKPLFVAGHHDSVPIISGGGLIARGYVFSGSFELSPLSPVGPPGGGRGFGWGRWSRGAAIEADTSPFSSGGTFSATVALDRTAFDAHVRRAAAARIGFCLTGWTALLFLGLTFRSSVRAVKAEHARYLAELQARHFEELSQAASGLAHETRNPLSLIRGRAQRITQRENPSSAVAADARMIVEECDRLAARLTQFILFAKPFAIHAEEVDPDSVIDEVLNLLEPDCESKNVRYVHQRAPRAISVLADRELMRQALFNLLHNAVKYTQSDSNVRVITQVEEGTVVIDVIDQGPGIRAEDVSKLFMPYFSTDPGGTGLGLSLVRKIALAHGWEITCHPADGGGARFRLTIPKGSGTGDIGSERGSVKNGGRWTRL